MDAYMKCLRWTLDSRVAKARAAGRGFFGRARARFRDHRMWVLGLGLASFLLTIVMFGVLPKQFQPEQDDDSSTVRVEMVPGTPHEQTQAVVDRVAHLLRQQKIVTSVYQRSFVGPGRVNAQLADERALTSVQFERGLAPEHKKIADTQHHIHP